MRYLIATDTATGSERLSDALRDHVDDDDTVFVVNSLRGGSDTSDQDVLDGRDALERVEEELGGQVTVDTHQLVRDNDPTTDILLFADEHDVDRIVIGIRKRTPTGKAVFGSVSQDVLLSAERPVLAVPRT
jgi:nucleotide-binding universal stress UspA family protein